MATSEFSGGGRAKGPVPPRSKDGTKPDWADGLKQLYDDIVDEPLPDAFKDLLSKLDKPS